MRDSSSSDPFQLLRQDYRRKDFLPGYELLNILGRGGQGLVLLGVKRSTGRRYAVKFLPPEQAHTFQPPAELKHLALLANLSHPYIVAIEDRGAVGDYPYIIMEYAGDRSLKDLFSRHPHPLPLALQYLEQAASGLSYLHQHGVLHLDIKPGNIFLLGETARLGDFGLIRPLKDSTTLLLSRAFGTERYVAPEVMERRAAKSASDIFALGRILEELLEAARADGLEPPRALWRLAQRGQLREPGDRPPASAFCHLTSLLEPERSCRRISLRHRAPPPRRLLPGQRLHILRRW